MIPNLNNQKHKSYRKRKPEPEFTDYQTYWEDTEGHAIKSNKFNSSSFNYKVEYDFVSIKINGLSLRAYLNEEVGKKINKRICVDFKFSLRCLHIWVTDEDTGSYFCPKCLSVDNQIIRNQVEYNNPQANQKIWRRDHDRQRWTNQELEYMAGYFIHELNDYTWLFLLREVPNRFRWLDVFKVFRKYGLNKEWLSFGKFIGLEIKMDRRVAYYAEQYTDQKVCTRYRISYLFIVYKLVQLFYPGFEQNVPNKKSQKWIEEKGDVWWKEICVKNNFKFKKSNISYISWNKKEFLKKWTQTMKHMGIGTS